jgi:hypothetical protein
MIFWVVAPCDLVGGKYLRTQETTIDIVIKTPDFTSVYFNVHITHESNYTFNVTLLIFTLFFHVREVPGSILSPKTGYPH